MSLVKDENFYVIFAWMMTRLNLKGVALMIYAIIYGYSQDGQSDFTGGRQYLCDLTGTTKPTVDKALDELLSADLIIKKQVSYNGLTFNNYKINANVLSFLGGKETLLGVKNFYEGGKETLLGGSIETLPKKKNIYINNESKLKEEEKNIIKKEKKNSELLTQTDYYFNEFWNAYPTSKRKVDKKRCSIAFAQIEHIDQVFDDIMRGLEAWKQSKEWTEQNGQYIPAPLVFIHQRRWEGILAEVDKQADENQAVYEMYKDYFNQK